MSDKTYFHKEKARPGPKSIELSGQRKVIICDTIQNESIVEKILSKKSPIIIIAKNIYLSENRPPKEHEQKKVVSESKSPRGIEVWHEYMRFRSTVVRRPWSERTLLDHERLVCKGGRLKIRGRKKGEPEKTMKGELYDLLNKPLAKIDGKLVKKWLDDNEYRPGRVVIPPLLT